MADDDEGAGKAVKPVFQPFNGAQVEMVGRLVQQQHVGVERKRAGDGRAAAFPARCRRTGARQVDAQLISDCFDFMKLRGIVAGNRIVAQCLAASQVGFLFQQHNIGAGDDGAPAFIGIDPVG